MNEPIEITCEGGGILSPHDRCTMCGAPIVESDGTVPPHKRMDLIAMIDRGDFEPEA